MVQSKILIYVVVGFLALGSVSSIFNGLKDSFFPSEKTYTKEAVELILKHKELLTENEKLRIENQVIEKDNERLQKEIPIDSAIVWDSHREYRDSLRAVFNPR
jgi:hypothetical protein